MVLFKKRITKALIRLRGCAGWSAPVLFANPLRQVFLRRGPIMSHVNFISTTWIEISFRDPTKVFSVYIFQIAIHPLNL